MTAPSRDSDTTQATRVLIEKINKAFDVPDLWEDDDHIAGSDSEGWLTVGDVRRLADALEAAQQDTQRLDWWEAHRNEFGLYGPGTNDPKWMLAHGVDPLTGEYKVEEGDSLRSVIDLARAEPDTEEEDTDHG